MNRYLVKIAATQVQGPSSHETELRPHQNRILERLHKSHGLVMDHSMGSGKTLTFLKAVERSLAENKEGRAFIAAPSSLISNIDKEVAKHHLNIDRSRVDALSYEKATRDYAQLSKNKYVIAIADEGHRLRNTNTKRHNELSGIISGADRRLISTGTSTYHKPSDISPLVNIAAGMKVLPEGKAFDDEYLHKTRKSPGFSKRLAGAPMEESTHLRHTARLSKILKEHVDHYSVMEDPESLKHFPKQIEKVIPVEMSESQRDKYKYLEGSMPRLMRMKIRMNLPLSKKESAQLNAFSTGVRQVSNSVKPYVHNPDSVGITPKIHTAVDNLERSKKEDKNFRGVVYSNYLGAGLNDYSAELKRRGIVHSLYTGELSRQKKDEARDAYNSGKVPVMLISSSGGEGVDLKGTKKVQVLEPHFNKSKINQVVARGVRYKSHDHLPENERQVVVEHYASQLPKSFFGFGERPHSIDDYLRQNSERKNDVSMQIKDLMK